MKKTLMLVALLGALASCARPIPDRNSTEIRGQYARTVVDSNGRQCRSELPLAVAFDGVDAAPFFAGDAPWTEALAFPVTRVASSDEMPDLVVTMDVRPAEHPNWLASTHSYCDGSRLRQRVTFYVAGDVMQMAHLAMHEIGHVLGVRHARGDKYGHSPAEWSIMYPKPLALMDGEADEPPRQWVRPDDVAALRRAWNSPDVTAFLESLPAVDEVDDEPAGLTPVRDSGVIITPVTIAPDPERYPDRFLLAVFHAAKNSQWRALGGLLLMGLVWLVRQKWSLAAWVPWLRTDRGGATLVLLMALLTGIAVALLADGPLGLKLVMNSLVSAALAAGGWSIVKKIIAPSDQK